MRYAWDQFDAYFGPARVGRVASAALRPVLAGLARWDRATAHRVQRYVTNSQHVARRIRRYYNREASVVHPPIDTAFFQPDASAAPGNNARRECLIVSALVPYKRIETAIDACRLAGVGLAIVGDGPERARLERVAAERGGSGGDTVRFLGRLSDDDVRTAYQRAAAVLMPGEEDFGIVPLEAQACGRPVVALARGGARETIVDGETGVLVEDPGSEAFAAGIRSALARSFDTAAIRRHAEGFGRARFGDAIDAIVRETRAGAAHPW
jgi:glycosyltransferase involved in cell wall biosynthesis